MALKERLSDDIKAAMLSGDRFVADTLRGLKAAVLDEEVATGKRDEGLADEAIEKIIMREVKKRNEAAKIYRDNGRDELAEVEQKEADLLSKYLPQQLTEAELGALIDEVIAGMGEVSPQQMGQIIGAAKAKAGNQADGAMLAKIVKEKLT